MLIKIDSTSAEVSKSQRRSVRVLISPAVGALEHDLGVVHELGHAASGLVDAAGQAPLDQRVQAVTRLLSVSG